MNLLSMQVNQRRSKDEKHSVATDLASRVAPEESELKVYLNMHPEQFRSQSRFTFRHIYFNPRRHGASLREDIENLVVTLNSDKGEIDAGSMGDVTSLEIEFSALTQSDMAQIFGETFSFEVGKLEVGRWSGPVTSEFGLHLVLVDAAQPGKLPFPRLKPDRIAELENTLDYPPHGSNEAGHPELQQGWNTSEQISTEPVSHEEPQEDEVDKQKPGTSD